MSNLQIRPGEKYALVAFETIGTEALQTCSIGEQFWISKSSGVTLDSYWREWLGSIRTERFESSNFFVVAKQRSETPEVFDQENHNLRQSIYCFYLGILFAGRIFCNEAPLLLTGGASEKGISVRELQELLPPVNFLGIEPDCPDTHLLATAADLSPNFRELWKGDALFKRLRKVINIYIGARTTSDILERLHQYCRCIEGFIIPSPGDTAKKFKSRTEVFIGPHHHRLMEDLYKTRSAIEHLNDHLYLSSRSRTDRTEIYKLGIISEFIARSCIVRVMQSAELKSYFVSDTDLLHFWKLPAKERQRVWGAPVDPLLAVHNFDPRSLSNADLGLSAA